jgi:hypothetical protein
MIPALVGLGTVFRHHRTCSHSQEGIKIYLHDQNKVTVRALGEEMDPGFD